MRFLGATEHVGSLIVAGAALLGGGVACMTLGYTWGAGDLEVCETDLVQALGMQRSLQREVNSFVLKAEVVMDILNATPVEVARDLSRQIGVNITIIPYSEGASITLKGAMTAEEVLEVLAAHGSVRLGFAPYVATTD